MVKLECIEKSDFCGSALADRLPFPPLSSNHSTKTEDETGLASEVETMKIVSLGLEDHGLRSYAALKRLVPKSGVLPPDTFF
jgi:hypothetical protein